MYIEDFIAQFSLGQIIHIENTQDQQYISLADARYYISKVYGTTSDNKIKFLDAIVYNSLISYQIWWDGFLWRGEFAEKIKEDRINIDIHNPDRRYDFLYHSRYNKRLINMKIRRLNKICHVALGENIEDYISYHDDMKKLNTKLSGLLWNKEDMKTVVFAVKMFGYGARIVFDKVVHYPMDIEIPIDSRLTKIYLYHLKIHNKLLDQKNTKEVKKFYKDISLKIAIPPLHLDSLLWIVYRKTYRDIL